MKLPHVMSVRLFLPTWVSAMDSDIAERTNTSLLTPMAPVSLFVFAALRSASLALRPPPQLPRSSWLEASGLLNMAKWTQPSWCGWADLVHMMVGWHVSCIWAHPSDMLNYLNAAAASNRYISLAVWADGFHKRIVCMNTVQTGGEKESVIEQTTDAVCSRSGHHSYIINECSRNVEPLQPHWFFC